MNDPHEAVLLGLMDRVLSGRMDFAEYERAYQGYFIDQLPAEATLDGLRGEFFAQAHELLDWTAEEPDAESRRYGWRDRGEYLDWLRAERATWSRDFGPRDIRRR